MNRHPHRRIALPLLLAVLLPAAASAHKEASGSISQEISADMAEARREVRRELATARAELETDNLELGQSLRFGRSEQRPDKDAALPKAEITPAGDFLIDGKALAIDAGQRRELLAYRGQVIDIARAGIELGERTAEVALEAVDRGVFRLLVGAMTGSLERRIEKTVRQTMEPGMRQICNSLPALHASQQRLAASLPQFQPYATLDADEIDTCMDEVRRGFASL